MEGHKFSGFPDRFRDQLQQRYGVAKGYVFFLPHVCDHHHHHHINVKDRMDDRNKKGKKRLPKFINQQPYTVNAERQGGRAGWLGHELLNRYFGEITEISFPATRSSEHPLCVAATVWGKVGKYAKALAKA